MNALDYILANYQQEKYQNNLAERAVLRALVHTLNKAELLMLQKKLKRGFSKWSVGKVLCDESTKVLGKRYPKKNESISALLKAFTDKQSGKVAKARAELRERFDKQSFQTQRKILQAMLSASKQDRVWAYKQLSNGWDDFFFEDVKNLWEQYHEKECVAVIIKHFPMEYVYENLSTLDTHVNYTNLCIKLIHHPKFQIDKERLKEDFVFYGHPEVEYLYILAKSKSKIEKGEATNLLFQQIVYMLNKLEAPTDEVLEGVVGKKASLVKELHVVRDILWCMGELGLVDELIAFEEWDNRVKYKFYSNKEVEYFVRGYNTISATELWNLYRQTIVECLPNEYQQLVQVKFTSPPRQEVSFEEMKQCNPALNTLVEKLGLTVI